MDTASLRNSPDHSFEYVFFESAQDAHAERSKCSHKWLKDFEIEQRLECTIREIDREKGLPYRKIIHLTGTAFFEEAKDAPCKVAAKCMLLLVSIGFVYPNGLGSFACFNSYHVGNLKDITTSEFAKANSAVQIFSNLGQGVTYITQLLEMLIIPSVMWSFKGLYNKAICQEIASIYSSKICRNPDLTPEEIAFLINRANKELARLDGFPIIKDGVEVEFIQSEIDREIKGQFIGRKIVYLVGCEIVKDVQSASWRSIFTKTAASVSLVAMTVAIQHPLFYGALACFEAFNIVNPKDLTSSDIDINTNATAVYSNLGHALEYIVAGCTLSGLTFKALLWNKYKKIARDLIANAYNERIQDTSLSKEVSDLFFRRKQEALAHYI